MKKGIFLILLIMMALNVRAQQDTQVSQYIFNGIYINPAYSGYKGDIFIQSYFRSQWVGVNGAPKSFAIAADGSFKDGSVGLGVILTNDQIGAQSITTGYVNYAYRMRVGEDENSRLAFGLSGGIVQMGIDGSKLNPLQPGDPSVPVASQSRLIPDANFGVYYANEKYFAGISATNILATFIDNNAQNYLVPVPQPHFYLTAGTLIPVNDEIAVKPVFLIKDDFKGPTTLDLDGFIIMNERLSFGAFYRSSIKLYQKNNLQNDLPKKNSFGAIAEFFVTPNVRIGYSYDQSLNALGNYNYGSHELSIGFYITKGRYNRNNDPSRRCFRF